MTSYARMYIITEDPISIVYFMEERIKCNDVEKRKRGRPRKKVDAVVKRKPTKYNMFVKETMKTMKEKYPEKTNKERMLECAILWREFIAKP